MPKLEVFFDYACPFCRQGYLYLKELLPQYPGLNIEWRPCEAHPRPESYGPHSDLCARGLFFAQEQGADLPKYHSRMFAAALNESIDIENLQLLAKTTEGLVESAEFVKALAGGCYEDKLLENNRLAWDVYEFSAVPSFKMNGKTLEATAGVGISKEQLAAFIEHNCQP